MKLDIYDSGEKVSGHKTPLVFIHGAWCSKWCWDRFIPFFEERFYRCVAMDLRGHGKSEGRENLKKNTLTDYVEDVHSVVESIGGKAVLIGHSMGGGVTEKYIAKYHTTAAVLMAAIPPQGSKVASSVSMREAPWKTIGSLFTGESFPLITDQKLTKLFFSEPMTEEELKRYGGLFQNEGLAAGMEMRRPIVIGDPNPYNIPILLIGGNEDRLVPPDDVKKTSQAYGVQPLFYDSGHVLMFDKSWEEIAKNIDQWLVLKGI